ncbi:dihydroorotate dehydrogenase electron transfer subunit [Parabacteroides sp. 52]|uniref:dihydroorotate dehydrogenase electron transfer subunit n=1 Tax=unclassified Parabacteroides TaxID=2649774 RepID=UPI0013D80883|nr:MULTISPECIES: dihydroorotate dehydrogenase electron transfer subunit [unclassified Parabacteroides]MDH6533477.1 dihydroorotate dehydrogenase electron transfer subunit [Parabacteroides sp. PM5-20]NDV54233.1 dihydroorotate dehydrogenase electron transfer subunit [Parabacteroides sp. 52]
MKKYILDMKVTENNRLHPNYCLLKLTTDELLPEMLPGQFVEVRVDNSPTTFLRRPISINFVDRNKNELWLLVQLIGDGTRKMATYRPGETVNVMLPLGNGFTMPDKQSNKKKFLLVGGGVGTAPLLYMGWCLKKEGFEPYFLLGARSEADLMQLDAFKQLGAVFITTEDGSTGESGYVTNHSVLKNESFDFIYTCGPKPMMVAVARFAAANSIACEVSLENTMACGIGACLCCVEKTKENHNVCVCTEGPVFNIDKLSWLN